MDQLTKLFSYKGNEVTFRNEKGVAYVNANEMARPFSGKSPKQWFDNQETHDFIHALAKSRGIEPMGGIRTSLNTSELAKIYPTLLIVVRGGIPGKVKQGTWLHEDVALEYAQWLSIDFKLWCNDRIKELLTTGFTTTKSIDDLIDNPDLIIKMATQLKDLRAQNDQQQQTINKAHEYFQAVKPKVEYYEDVLTSKTTITTNIIAQELGVSAIKLNQMLRSSGVIYRQGKNWLLRSEHRHRGLTDMMTYKYIDSKGVVQTDIQMRWTEKGRQFIHNLFKN